MRVIGHIVRKRGGERRRKWRRTDPSDFYRQGISPSVSFLFVVVWVVSPGKLQDGRSFKQASMHASCPAPHSPIIDGPNGGK